MTVRWRVRVVYLRVHIVVDKFIGWLISRYLSYPFFCESWSKPVSFDPDSWQVYLLEHAKNTNRCLVCAKTPSSQGSRCSDVARDVSRISDWRSDGEQYWKHWKTTPIKILGSVLSLWGSASWQYGIPRISSGFDQRTFRIARTTLVASLSFAIDQAAFMQVLRKRGRIFGQRLHVHNFNFLFCVFPALEGT